MGWGAVFMVGSFPVAMLAGAVLGFLSGLGIGGGSLLVLWLTWAVGLDAPSARLINLLFFIPAALCACFFRLRQGHLSLKKLWKAMALGCLAAAASALWGSRMDTQLLQRLFGGLLVVTGIRELFYKPKKPS